MAATPTMPRRAQHSENGRDVTDCLCNHHEKHSPYQCPKLATVSATRSRLFTVEKVLAMGSLEDGERKHKAADSTAEVWLNYCKALRPVSDWCFAMQAGSWQLVALQTLDF
eukprot:1922371-Amphidinium_carterae.1